MLRYIAVFALLFATPSFAQEHRNAAPQVSAIPGVSNDGDRFLITNDACGASRFSRLVGKSYQLYRAALPGDAIVRGAIGGGEVNISDPEQRATQMMTLEFRPQQLNVVVDVSARILSVGCY